MALLVALLLPCVFAAAVSVQTARMEKQFQREEQSRTGDSVYVMHKETTIGLGRFGVSIYPRTWAAVFVFTGLILSIVGLTFLLFVRL
jgi:hypothetical protein